DQEQEERDSTHAPRVAESDAALTNRDRVQMQKHIREHHHHAVSPIARRRVAKDAFPDLRIANRFAYRHESSLLAGLHLDKRIGVVPLAQFFLEFPALVDHDLAVFTDGDRPAFQRTRGRSLEIHSGDLEPAAVARTLEFFLPLEPIGSAAEVSAGG